MSFEKSIFPTGETLMMRLENGFEKKKVVYFSLWEDLGALQGELEVEQRAKELKG